MNRFRARYRLARAFRGLHLEGYSDATTQGYDALAKVSLHWSAFEQLMKATRITSIRDLENGYNFDACFDAIRRCDGDARFFKFVRVNLTNRALAANVDNFLVGRPCSALELVKAVRHIFFHGPLTPNVDGLSPHTVSGICDELSLAVVTVMDTEFLSRVEDLVNAYPP